MASETLSIVMGIYNTEAFLAKSLDCILAQTFSDFEMICVNDGSTDGSLEILNNYAARDSRVRVVSFSKNQGISTALNEAIRLAQGKYIGIADSDDLYLPQKFATQIQFLEANADYVAVGSSASFIDTSDKLFGWEMMPESDAALRWRMLFNSPFFHPSLLLRAEAIKKIPVVYNPCMKAAIDYDLWPRILKYGKGYNLKEPFLFYRIHNNSISLSNSKTQVQNRDSISSTLLLEAFGEHGYSSEQIGRLRRMFLNKPRFFETPLPRPIIRPTEEDIKCYLNLLSRYSQALPKKTARSFLYEEQAFLGEAYLSQIGLEEIDLPSLLDVQNDQSRLFA